jgi:ABC-2 type transport system permease protein
MARSQGAVITAQTISGRRRALVGWTIGIACNVAVMLAFYPTVRNRPEFRDLVNKYPKELLAFIGGSADITSPTGYLRIELFSLMVPLLFMIVAISTASSILAGEEQEGTLALVLARPVSRRRVLLEKALALLCPLLVLGVILFGLLAVVGSAAGVHVALSNLAAATLAVVQLALVFGIVALAIGAATGSKSTATGVASALAVAAYLVEALAGLVDWLRSGRRLSPVSQTIGLDPLRTGFHPLNSMTLLIVTALVLWLGSVLFDRRDLER